MTDPLTEAVARAMAKTDDKLPLFRLPGTKQRYMIRATAALAIARPAIRREALEEAAGLAGDYPAAIHGALATDPHAAALQAAQEICASILALMEKPDV